MQVYDHEATDKYSEDYINAMSNMEFLEFLDRVQSNYGKEIE